VWQWKSIVIEIDLVIGRLWQLTLFWPPQGLGWPNDASFSWPITPYHGQANLGYDLGWPYFNATLNGFCVCMLTKILITISSRILQTLNLKLFSFLTFQRFNNALFYNTLSNFFSHVPSQYSCHTTTINI
jgi:hypothetical protein